MSILQSKTDFELLHSSASNTSFTLSTGIKNWIKLYFSSIYNKHTDSQNLPYICQIFVSLRWVGHISSASSSSCQK